jgi:hypothetical protein
MAGIAALPEPGASAAAALPSNVPGAGRAQLLETLPDPEEAASTPVRAADRALAEVANVARTVMPPHTEISSISAAQVHYDESALKLANAIKSLADGMHSLERRQNDTTSNMDCLRETVKVLEDTTNKLKVETKTVVTTAKRALMASMQQSDMNNEIDRFIEGRGVEKLDPRSRLGSLPQPSAYIAASESRMQEVEKKLESLIQWQDDEMTKAVAQITKRETDKGLHEIVQQNTNILKDLSRTVSLMQGPEVSSSDINQIYSHMQEHYYRRDELDELLQQHKAAVRVVPVSTAPDSPSLARLEDASSGRLQGVEVRLDRSEARLDKTIADLSDRLDPLHEFIEQQRLSTWQSGKQLPEVVQKLDQLWSQCQYYFAKVKEHDVHFGFFRNSFESHKQNLLDLGDGYETSSPLRISDSSSVFPSSWRKEEGVVEPATKAVLAQPFAAPALFGPRVTNADTTA